MAINTKFYLRTPSQSVGNGTEITSLVSVGSTINYKLDEALDGGLLLLNNITRSEPYPRMNKIDWEVEGTIRQTFYISGSSVELSSKDSFYNHELRLLELTKKHELLFHPDRTFTANEDGSAKYNLYEIVESLRVTVPFDPTIPRAFNIPLSVRNVLEAVDAPQIFVQQGTLRESLNTILGVIDATYRLLDNGDIQLEYFNERKNKVDATINTTAITRSNDLNNFGSNIKAGARNVLKSKIPVYNETNNRVRGVIVPISNRKDGAPREANTEMKFGLSFRAKDVILGDSNQLLKFPQ
jgi:hypothetical protein